MSNCAVYGCDNYYRKTKQTHIRYFTFPKDRQLREKWERCCRRPNPLPKEPRICSQHFKEEDYHKPLRQRLLNYSPVHMRKLKFDAVPTINLPDVSSLENAPRRSKRHRKRIRQNLVREILSYSIKEPNKIDRDVRISNNEVLRDTAAQVDAVKHDQGLLEQIKELKEMNKSLNLKIAELTADNNKHEEEKRKLHEQIMWLKSNLTTESSEDSMEGEMNIKSEIIEESSISNDDLQDQTISSDVIQISQNNITTYNDCEMHNVKIEVKEEPMLEMNTIALCFRYQFTE